ncbi:M23 family metallopeptidase [Anaerovoracaceae bacterium 42-11]
MTDKKSQDSLSQGQRFAGSSAKMAAKGTAKTARGLFNPGTRKLYIVLIVIFFFLVLFTAIGGTSQSQMSATYYLTANKEDNGWNMPKKKDTKNVLWNKEEAINQSNALMQIISEKKETDRKSKEQSISSFCIENGYDVQETLAHLKDSPVVAYTTGFNESSQTMPTTASQKNQSTSKKDKGTVIQDFSLAGVTPAQLSKFSFESINQNWISGSVQRKIYDSGKWYVDEYGLCKYKNDDGTEDYMVALGSFFGETGNRYRVTFKNGTSATFLKFDAKATKDTIGNAGIVGADGGLMEFIVDQKKLNGSILYHGNVAYHPKRIFDQITKIELIEGTMSSSFASGIVNADMEVLSAYSVALSNVELTKVDGFLGGYFKHVGEKYVNEKGFSISVAWFGEKAGKIDYEKDLKNRIDKFLQNGGGFYTVDYERENGNIKVYTKTITIKAGESTKDNGSNISKKDTESKAAETKTIHYVVPILVEKDISEISFDLFEIDPNEDYVNDDKTKISNQQAITTLAENTAAMLYDTNFSAAGGVNISDLSGVYAWPAPGVNYITSLYGNRYHPVYHTTKFHSGLDIGTPSGTPIVACEDGVVSIAGTYGGYGYAVKIEHEGGISSLYGHLQTVQVRPGQKVTKGQQIALSGNSGISTGPHLHFSIFVGGSTVDPTGYVLTPETYKKLIIAPDA